MDLTNNLVVGDTSQLAKYFPSKYDKVSSRDFNIEKINNTYDRIYLTFAEQRTFLKANEEFFNKVNVDYTIKIVDLLKDRCNKLIIYSTSELWNNVGGCISVDMKYDYNYTPYIKSKELLCEVINNNKDKYHNVIIIYPFNFNSLYRKSGFLFSKIFDSIINRKKIKIGDVDINRDIIHPKIIVDESIRTNEDIIIGSGCLINVKKFIIDLYHLFNLNYLDFITIENELTLKNKRNEYFSCESYSSYLELIELTKKDFYEYKIS